MLRITIMRTSAPPSHDGVTGVSVLIADDHAPALRSALDELRNTIGGKLTDSHLFAREDALTRASIAVATLAAGVNQVVLKEDPDYVA